MGEARFLQELALYAASAALSCLVLFAGLRQLDPNRSSSKKAQEQQKEIAKRLGRPLVQTNPYEPEIFSHGKLLYPQKGVLLYGPSGTGKTVLAKAISNESGAVFINVRISNLMSKWFGDAQKLENARVMVLAATNRPSELDEAILRCFSQAFEIGIPDRSERAKILKVILKGEQIEEEIDYDHIARLCEGFTGSDIFELCKQAAYFPVRELLEDEKKGKTIQRPRAMKQSDLEEALLKFKKVKRGTNEYRLALQSRSWPRNIEPGDAILKISEIMTHIVSKNQSESESQDA